MWAANNLNEEECRSVMTYPQCQYDRVICSPPDDDKILCWSWDHTCQPNVSKHQWRGTKVKRAVCRSVTLAN
ncbi:hypothetical protein TNCV_1674611 [Trichonephila clavipes]|nr:hypothetical protein TNCV_1674611 [Trichonephila clavipes]